MPEGPEIRREADKIGKALSGAVIESAFFEQAHLAPLSDALVGCEVEAVMPRGKALLIRFSNQQTLYSHNQLYGVWRIVPRDKLPNTRRTLRVALHTREHSALLFSASSIELLETGTEESHPYIKKLGPDVLASGVTWRDVHAQLTDRRFARRSLGALYLDQSFVAGLGNYLRSEILHVAGVHPAARPADLEPQVLECLAKATVSLSRRSYKTGGVTNEPTRVKTLRKSGLSRSKYRFAIFDRAGLNCYTCGGNVRRIEVGSRRLYLCAGCQPRPKS